MNAKLLMIAMMLFLVVPTITLATMTVQINSPANGSSTGNKYMPLNFTVYDTGNIKASVFVNPNSSRLNAKYGLACYYDGLANASNQLCNFSTNPVSPDEDGLVRLFHLDNRSEHGESAALAHDFASGSNGTISGATFTSDGRIGGAYDFDGVSDSIASSFSQDVNFSGVEPYSISLWMKRGQGQTNTWPGVVTIFDHNAGSGRNSQEIRMNQDNSVMAFERYTDDDNYGAEINYADLTADTWHFVVYTFDGTQCHAYLNTVLKHTSDCPGDSIPIASEVPTIGATNGGGSVLNGSLDEVAIWNRTLNSTEINSLYLMQRDTYYWQVNASTTTGSILSDVNQFNIEPNATLTVDFSDETGKIRDNFYGVNIHGWPGAYPSFIDTDGDGAIDDYSNYTWHREKLLAANITYLRGDMALGSVLVKEWYNPKAESWTTTTDCGQIGKGGDSITCSDVPYGWYSRIESNSNGTINRSTDAHSGSYSVNITSISGGDSHAGWGIGGGGVQLRGGSIYNFTMWVKSTTTGARLLVQRLDTWNAVCQDWHSGSGNWEQLNCTFVAPDIAEGFILHAILSTDAQSMLIDDMHITENGTEYQYWKQTNVSNYGNINIPKNITGWAYDNDIKMLWIASYMPKWYADYGTDCATDVSRCGARNTTEYGNLVVDWIDEITNDGEYNSTVEIEVWNEPEISFFLPDLATDHVNKSIKYNQLYNKTYEAIKAKYPDMEVGGPSATSHDYDLGTYFLYNFTTSMDFFSFHEYIYEDEYDTDERISNVYNNWSTDCSLAGANCERLMFNEWNTGDASVLVNDSVTQYLQLGLGYAWMINNYPENFTSVIYQWAEDQRYNDSGYGEYPKRWTMVAEPGLEGDLYAAYNITRDFGTTHMPGNAVVTSSSDDSDIRVVATSRSDDYYITALSTGVESVNLTISVNSGAGISSITDVTTDETYTVTDNVANVGLISYEGVRFFTARNDATGEAATSDGASGVPIETSSAEQAEPVEELNACASASFLERLTSNCKVADDDICDPGENPLTSEACKLTSESISSGDFLYQIWVVRLALLITLIMLLKNSKYFPLSVLIVIGLFVLNGAITPIPQSDLSTQPCSIANLGACFFKSNPLVGWILVVVAGFWLMRHVIKGQNEPSRREQ